MQYIADIEPIDDRLIYITLRGSLNTTIINTYMPPADRPQVEKQKAYENLHKITRERKNKGPIYILGDFNSRLIYPTNEVEERIMGNHTLHQNGAAIENLTDEMMDNRDLLIEYCVRHELKVTNTMYRKPPNKTATYRKDKRRPDPTVIEIFSAEKHEQLGGVANGPQDT